MNEAIAQLMGRLERVNMQGREGSDEEETNNEKADQTLDAKFHEILDGTHPTSLILDKSRLRKRKLRIMRIVRVKNSQLQE
ncbi:unnamed protein product [Rhizophagus irregularis]|nr:unnamed protein product [Rhizophagus irregularis]